MTTTCLHVCFHRFTYASIRFESSFVEGIQSNFFYFLSFYRHLEEIYWSVKFFCDDEDTCNLKLRVAALNELNMVTYFI